MIGVYKITNKITKECYVGSSKHISKRWTEHFCKGYGANHSHEFQKAIDTLGRDGFMFEVLEECDTNNLREREAFYIKHIKPEYNTVVKGRKLSDEMRQRIREKLTGLKQSPETILKRKESIRQRHLLIPQTNAGHRKRCRIGDVEYESVKAAAEAMGVHASTVTHAIKKNHKVKGQAVCYVV